MWPSLISRTRKVLLYAVLLALTAAVVPASLSQSSQESSLRNAALTSTQQRRVELKARKAYSTFDSAGITSMTCEGTVDWATLFKGQTNRSFREQVLPVLDGTRFLVTLEKDGTVKVATRFTIEPVNPQAADRARASIRDFGGAISTVFEGWARFAVTADLPVASNQYQLDKVGDHYLVAFRNGPADVAITMDRSFVMNDDLTDTADRTDTLDSSILSHPKFTATPGGYLVTSWSVAFPHGKGSDLSVDAKYMQVEGVEVPAQMTLHSSLPSFGEITLPLLLTNYQFQR